MDLDLDNPSGEDYRNNSLPSEHDDLVDRLDSRERYLDILRTKGVVRDSLSTEERLEKMESDALSVYEEALTNPSLKFSERRQVADKVLDLRGVGKKLEDDKPAMSLAISEQGMKQLSEAFGVFGTSLRSVEDEREKKNAVWHKHTKDIHDFETVGDNDSEGVDQ